MNKLKTAIRNAEVDGLSDSIIRNFKADEKAQSEISRGQTTSM